MPQRTASSPTGDQPSAGVTAQFQGGASIALRTSHSSAPTSAEASAGADALVRHQLLHAAVLAPNGQWLVQHERARLVSILAGPAEAVAQAAAVQHHIRRTNPLHLMTNPNDTSNTADRDSQLNSVSGRASYPLGYSAFSGVSKGPPAPSGQGLARRRGTPDEEAATEGGSQPQGQEGHPEHAAPAIVAPPPRTRRRKYQRRQRPHVRNTRFSDDELARVTAGANASGLTLAGFLARAALSAARDLDRTASAVAGEREVIAELFAARRHLGHVGNNLNQITRAINAGAHPPELDAVIAATTRAIQRVQRATDQLLGQD
ncbi:MobC family plasmid mobilization relaxosome protein [Streptomyces collinus]|uniref:MobC family plasmid mobilization relaxosome protein n=1 Tax=Streptomyces collinus TaxID=42684 RepID=UPI0037D84626